SQSSHRILKQKVTCEASGKNLSNIPTDLSQNVTKLSLTNNKITLKDIDKEILRSFIKLTELYLNENMIIVLYNNSFCNLTKLVVLDISSNHISTVHKTAFAGLNQLSVLNLSYNMIIQLDSDIFTSLKSLTALNLQYNSLKYFHIKSPFKLIKIVLAGNPWTCSCDLLDLQIWLTASNVTMEYENNTICMFPNTKEKSSIKTAAIQPADCKIEQASLENTVTSTSAIKLKSSAFLTLPLPGKSWTFLAGVLGFVLSITLLIFMAARCPTWYHYLVSYSHHHLEENNSEMLEQELSADMSSFPTLLDTNNEDRITFEKTHTFVPVEDGFIEDKYIDSYVTEET
uniref:Uncharacterized protein n=1 Tax=Melopsittacus undulatus TaxID=13146 RepID=A0A8C6J179_MELUD